LTESAAKPRYLGLLNAISIGERNAGQYLKAWADVTRDPELKRALGLVAAREATHAEVFRQRIERLGFSVRDREDTGLAERLSVYGDPARSDLEKIQWFRREEAAPPGGDPFRAIDERIADESVDPLTRDTLRWYVHEERDSLELLSAVCARLEAVERR
jgi:rubrerythrin